jgi:hypothetical protein
MYLRISHRRVLETVVHPAMFILMLLLSSIAGRQLFMDGTTNVVQSLQNPFWFPFDQETPRRFFALLWTTAPVRWLGIVAPDSLGLATLLYGIAAYLQIALPLIVLLRSRLILPVRSLLVVLFLAATVFLANFAATELLFALGLTAMFVVYTLDNGRDARCTKRLIIASLLIASYEVVALSNLLLATATFLSAEPMSKTRRLLIAILVSALPFQILCFLSEPIRPGQNVFNLFVFELVGIGCLGLLAAILLAKSLGRWHAAPTVMVVIGIGIPLLALVAPEQFMYFRTREFQYAHPSRVFSAGLTVLIAFVPILLNQKLWIWPTHLLNWIGGRSLSNVAVAALSTFYGVSILASADAFTYRKRLGMEFSRLSGLVLIKQCEFCINPEKFGYPNLGELSHWPAYSMAYSLQNTPQARVIVMARGALGDIDEDQIAAFINGVQSRYSQPIRTSLPPSDVLM